MVAVVVSEVAVEVVAVEEEVAAVDSVVNLASEVEVNILFYTKKYNYLRIIICNKSTQRPLFLREYHSN